MIPLFPHFKKSLMNPSCFDSPPEAKNEVIKFCSDGVKNSTLSSEALRNEINTRIVSDFYQNWLSTHKYDTSVMPSYEEVMSTLDLNNMHIAAV